MPDGSTRSLPKTEPSFGTVTMISTGGSWNAATVTLAEPTGDRFWLIGWFCDALTYLYNLGASQNATCTNIGMFHNGDVGSAAVGILKKTPGVDWAGTFDLNTGSTVNRASSAVMFHPTTGFRGEVVRTYRTNGASSTSYAFTPVANPMQTPGGLAFFCYVQDSGGTGPQSISGTGWVSGQIQGLLGVAYYRLPLDSIFTPPTITVSSGRSDFWQGMMVYIR